MINFKAAVVFVCLFAVVLAARRRKTNGCQVDYCHFKGSFEEEVGWPNIKSQYDLCPRGWDHYCNDTTKCVLPMTAFANMRQCLRKGGIPGVIACLEADIDSIDEKYERMCVIDLKNGKFGFAKNLRDALKKLDAEEAKEKLEEEAEIKEFDEEFNEEFDSI